MFKTQAKFNDVFIIGDTHMFGNKNKLLLSSKCVKNAIKTMTTHCVRFVFNMIVISKIIVKIILYTNLLNVDEVINN